MIKYIVTRWELIMDSSRASFLPLSGEETPVDDKCTAPSRCIWDLENEA